MYIITRCWTIPLPYCLFQSGGDGSDSFGQLDLNSEDNEDQLLKMMQGMMSSLLSRDVLYPSLMELCKQVSLC